MAYPTHIAATLSGATTRQLTYWRRPRSGTPLLVPELGRSGNTLLYSFRDVVALRTFVYLRRDLPLQRVRKAVETLRRLTKDEAQVDIDGASGLSEQHLSQYRLYTAGESVVWQRPDGSYVDLYEQPGSLRLAAVMEAVFGPFENRQGEAVVPLYQPRPNVEVDPDTRGGFPVIRGTRIDFDLVASLVRDGVPPEEISAYYPSVTTEAARDAAELLTLVERNRSRRLASTS